MDKIIGNCKVYRMLFPNDKSYIGVTSRKLKVRMEQHDKDARLGSKLRVHCAIRKYGIKSVTVEILNRYRSKRKAFRAEVYYIDEFRTMERRFGYNMSEGGEGLGITKEVIERRSESIRRTMSSPSFRKRRSEIGKEVQNRPEVKKKLSESLEEYWSHPENHEKHSKIMNSEEVVDKISKGTKEAWKRPEYRESVTTTLKEVHSTPEFKERHREATIEGLADPEVREKISKSKKQMWKESRDEIISAQRAGWNKPGVRAKVRKQRQTQAYRDMISRAKKAAFKRRKELATS